MIDFHSHILPGMDDGSRHVEESLALLRLLADQGVTTVVATPHFYADRESVDAFLERRRASLLALTDALQTVEPFGVPAILLGAEVRYYAGIGHMEDIRRLCVEGTKLLLIELTMSTWSEYTVRELVAMASGGKVRPMMAHLDRYMGFQKSATLERLYESGMLMQFNADLFVEKKRRALSMFRKGMIHALGSDCHDPVVRPPRMGEAHTAIAKKYGEDAWCAFQADMARLLG